MAASLGGRVIEVNAREGDLVRKGQVLLRLDTERLDNEIARLAGQLEGARTEILQLERMTATLAAETEGALAAERARLGEAEEAVRLERERLATDEKRRAADERLAGLEVLRRRTELERIRELLQRDLVARVDAERADQDLREAEERLDRARIPLGNAAVRLAQGRVTTASHALELAGRQFALRRQELELRLASRRAEAAAGAKTLANLELERSQAVLRAHVDGMVTLGDVKAGDLIEAGRPVFAIAQQQGFRIDAAVAAADVGRLQVGMRARVRLDAFDHREYGTLEGTIYYLSPDAEAADGGQGPYYVVRIRPDRDEVGRGSATGRLKFGMTGTIEIVTSRDSILKLALRGMRSGL